MKYNKVFRWVSRKIIELWVYIYKSVSSGKAFAVSISCLTGLLVIAFFASFFITPKPWHVQFAQAILGMFAGGAVGIIAGIILGGIGLAMAGTAIGLAGWLVGAIFGATVGGFFGILSSFILNPTAYSFHILKFCLVAIFALLIALLIYKLVMLLLIKLKNG
mgnify:CR=1 FL=1